MEHNIKNIVMSFGLSVLLLFNMSPNMAWAGDESTDNTQQYVVYSKDLITGIEEYETVEVTPDLIHDTESYVPDYEVGNGISPASVIGGVDTRQEIMNTYNFPYKAICKVVTTWYNTKYGTVKGHGTGFMIHNYYMLTAGHNIYEPEFGGYCDKIEVYPARNRIYAPYGPYNGVEAKVTNEFVEDVDDQAEDWGLVKLNSDVGSTTGYFGLDISTNGYDLLQKNISVTGYPTDKSDGGVGMWKGTGTVKSQNMYEIGYTCDTYKGDSGAPVYLSNNRVVAIHVRGINPTNDYNEGTKINSKVSSIINLWIP